MEKFAEVFKTFHTQTGWVLDVFETFVDSSSDSKNNSPQRSTSTLFSDHPYQFILKSARQLPNTANRHPQKSTFDQTTYPRGVNFPGNSI